MGRDVQRQSATRRRGPALLPAAAGIGRAASAPLMTGRPTRLILAAVSLVCLLWQCLLLQTHVHLPPVPVAPAAHGSSASATISERTLSDDEADCALCRELAQAPDYLASAADPFPQPAATLAILGIATLSLWPSRHMSPGWQGRAPPVTSGTL